MLDAETRNYELRITPLEQVDVVRCSTMQQIGCLNFPKFGKIKATFSQSHDIQYAAAPEYARVAKLTRQADKLTS